MVSKGLFQLSQIYLFYHTVIRSGAMLGTGDMAILALAPEHNATEIRGIQAVLVIKGLGRASILCPKHMWQ